MTRAELVERIKERVAARLCAPGSRPSYMQDDMAHDIATAALAAIEAAGCVVVPREPSDEMLAQGDLAYIRKLNDMGSAHPTEHPFDGGGPSGYRYRAMLAASPLAKEGGDHG
jgi:hypothetical protein